jgi:dolichyl-phosphate-mannose--protein O-mannosyl transferase
MPEEEKEDTSIWDYVTCMSSVKLRHKVLDTRLHSADIAYGSGSKQQAVTGNPDSGDPGSYWQIRSADEHGGTACLQGDTLQHGDKIRLMHLRTKKNLHSHQYQSPLSQKQEVSAFGEDGNGDGGDVWELMVREKGDVYAAGWGGPWLRDSIVRFKHVVTGQYLFSHRKQFNNGPVDGMNEITCSPRADDRTLWSVDEGLFHPKQAE